MAKKQPESLDDFLKRPLKNKADINLNSGIDQSQTISEAESKQKMERFIDI